MTRILVFAKQPVPGRVKTRLIPALGAEGAARLAAEMVERTVEEALATGLAVELCGDPDPTSWYEGPEVALSAQGGGGLGQRLARAAARVAGPALLIGTDCPGLHRGRLLAAAHALEQWDAVIHPAEDGGYVLLALRRFDGSLFEGIDWSTPAVAAQTIARIEGLGWSLCTGEILRDIDEPADLLPLPGGERVGVRGSGVSG
ncbi:MAG TPA: TIGR04282 family arsenosugar biosynthesis glycosyltransferase [Allosphingosinicella sp.]|jgi:hypothetical protein